MSRCLGVEFNFQKCWQKRNCGVIQSQYPGTFCPVKRHKIGPTSMASEIRESALLGNSRYEDD